MEFISEIHSLRARIGLYSVKLTNDKLIIRIPSEFSISKLGFIKDGIGVILKPSEKKKASKYTLNSYILTEERKEYIPTNLKATGYVFKIIGKPLTDLEIAFYFRDARTIL